MYSSDSASMYGIGLNVRNRPQCTESASMYSSLIGSEASHEKINYLCLNVLYIEAKSASMYGIGLNVQLSDWCTLRHSQSENCTLRPIPYIEADSLTFDSNSTSDRNLSDVLKISRGCQGGGHPGPPTSQFRWPEGHFGWPMATGPPLSNPLRSDSR